MNFENEMPEPKVTSTKEEIDAAFLRVKSTFPTRSHYFEVICQFVAPDGVRCECGVMNTQRKFGERTLRCRGCNVKIFVTANTFFHGVKRPEAYITALFVLSVGIAISDNEFAKRVGIAQSTASSVMYEVADAVAQGMVDTALLETSDLKRAVGKRSKETPAREHPFAEQADKEKSINLQKKPIPAKEQIEPADPIENAIYNLLLAKPMSLDDLFVRSGLAESVFLSKIAMLEIYGFINAVPGNIFTAVPRYSVLKKSKVARAETAEVKRFIDYVRCTHHRVSRKYLQRYAVRYWCFIDADNCTFEALVALLVPSSRRGYKQLISYVSPLQIEIPLPKVA